MWIDHPFCPLVASLKPPRLFAAFVSQRLRIGQAPVPEFRAHQRLVTGLHRISLRTEQPAGPICKVSDELIPSLPAVRNGGIEVVVCNVGLQMKTRGKW